MLWKHNDVQWWARYKGKQKSVNIWAANKFYFEYSCRKNGTFIEIEKGGPEKPKRSNFVFLYILRPSAWIFNLQPGLEK